LDKLPPVGGLEKYCLKNLRSTILLQYCCGKIKIGFAKINYPPITADNKT